MSHDWIKRQAEIIAAVAVFYALASGIIIAFGGSIPPWATATDFKQLKENVNIIIDARDAQRCADWNRRLENARKRLATDADNALEYDIIAAAKDEIRRTPNCQEK